MRAITSRRTGCPPLPIRRVPECGESRWLWLHDARVLPRRNVMLSSSFTGWQNYMRPLGELVKDTDAMKAFGGTMVLWDFHARKPRQVFEVPGVPLEVRWAWGEDHNYAFTSTALTSKIWLVKEDKDGKWHAQPVAEIGDPSKMPLPLISASAPMTRPFSSTVSWTAPVSMTFADPTQSRSTKSRLASS